MTFRAPKTFLITEIAAKVFTIVIYVIGLALYLHFIKQSNATDTCKRRMSLYARHGYTSVNCDVLGTEISASVFAVILVIVVIVHVVFLGFALKQLHSTPASNSKLLGTSAVFKKSATFETTPV